MTQGESETHREEEWLVCCSSRPKMRRRNEMRDHVCDKVPVQYCEALTETIKRSSELRGVDLALDGNLWNNVSVQRCLH